jgi:hypothetical protein
VATWVELGTLLIAKGSGRSWVRPRLWYYSRVFSSFSSSQTTGKVFSSEYAIYSKFYSSFLFSSLTRALRSQKKGKTTSSYYEHDYDTYLHGRYGTNTEAITDGIDITDWKIDDVTFSMWDFAGQTVYYNTHQACTYVTHSWRISAIGQ